MDGTPTHDDRGCVLGWDPSHCPLDVDCRFWSRLEDRCRYAERREREAREVLAGGQPAAATGSSG